MTLKHVHVATVVVLSTIHLNPSQYIHCLHTDLSHKLHAKRWIDAVQRTQTTRADAHSCQPKNGGLYAGLIDLLRNPRQTDGSRAA